MSVVEATRTFVSSSSTRKTGENFEKIIFQAEATLPTGLTLEEGPSDLNGTVLSALQGAEEARTRQVASRISKQEDPTFHEASKRNKGHIDGYEFQKTRDGFLMEIEFGLRGSAEAERRIKELTGAIVWTLTRLYQKQPAGNGK